MIILASQDFDELCRSPGVSEQIGSIETNRKKALKGFWSILFVGLAAAAGTVLALQAAGLTTMAWIGGAVLLVIAFGIAFGPISKASAGLKIPVLESLAAKSGMTYQSSGFAPPLYADAKKVLFGSWISTESFSDLFSGTDEAGNFHAVYEACLQRRTGKHTQTVFTGQIYALQRRMAGSTVTAIVPDRGMFNFFKPARGMERVKLESEPEFEKKFEVYSTDETEAKRLLFDSLLRRRLLDLAQQGRVFAYFGPEGALVAASGKDRFEPGSMFRSRSGDERVRLMFDDVCASMAVLGDLKARLA